jgi:uncharacterized protein YceH (UPF0502 family)
MSGNIVFLIPIVAIIGGILLAAYKANLKAKSTDNAKNISEQLNKQITQLQQELAEVKERTAVLEKIVTSQDYDLKNEINSL